MVFKVQRYEENLKNGHIFLKKWHLTCVFKKICVILQPVSPINDELGELYV